MAVKLLLLRIIINYFFLTFFESTMDVSYNFVARDIRYHLKKTIFLHEIEANNFSSI